jgi:hypothetical protein
MDLEPPIDFPEGRQEPWWAEVAELRERIEARKRREGGGGRARTTLTLSESAFELQEAELRSLQRARWRRESPTLAERLGRKPDRLAAWAVALGFLLVIAALIGGH